MSKIFLGHLISPWNVPDHLISPWIMHGHLISQQMPLATLNAIAALNATCAKFHDQGEKHVMGGRKKSHAPGLPPTRASGPRVPVGHAWPAGYMG